MSFDWCSFSQGIAVLLQLAVDIIIHMGRRISSRRAPIAQEKWLPKQNSDPDWLENEWSSEW